MSVTQTRRDSELQVAGVQMTRSEFNALYIELVKSLREIEARTGLKPKTETDLATMVKVNPDFKFDGLRNAVYMGWYLQQTKASIPHCRFRAILMKSHSHSGRREVFAPAGSESRCRQANTGNNALSCCALSMLIVSTDAQERDQALVGVEPSPRPAFHRHHEGSFQPR